MAENEQALEAIDEPVGLSNIDRCAILLMSMGEDNAAEVLKHLGPRDVQSIGGAMTRLKGVKRDDVQNVLEGFLEEVAAHAGMGVASDDYLKKMLKKALGDEKASSLIDRIMLGGSTSGLDTLKWMDARSIADVIRNEHPQIQAIVIAFLDADQSAAVLAYFQEKIRLDIIMRVASLDTVQPDALQELNDILEKQFSGNQNSQKQSMGGQKVAAEIMNNLDSNIGNELMDSIKESDEDLAATIEDLMFVFANLIDVEDRDIQVILREVNSDQLILALKGADDDLKDKIFDNMSKRAAELLKDDLEAKGPVKVSEVEAAQKDILNIARKLADAGEIQLGGAGGEAMI